MENSNVTSISNANVGKAFNAVIKGLCRDDIGEILFNWNESELNYDGDRIICYPGRDGRYSPSKEGGKSYVSKREFLAWIFSDDPFDEKVYGSEIRNNSEWESLIQRARDAALMESHRLEPVAATQSATTLKGLVRKPALPVTIAAMNVASATRGVKAR